MILFIEICNKQEIQYRKTYLINKSEPHLISICFNTVKLKVN